MTGSEVTHRRIVALIGRGAVLIAIAAAVVLADRTSAALASFIRTAASIATLSSIGFGGIGALAGCAITGSGVMALIGGCASDSRAGGSADTSLAGLAAGAEGAIIAARSIRFVGIGALSIRRVAHSGIMALIAGRASHRV